MHAEGARWQPAPLQQVRSQQLRDISKAHTWRVEVVSGGWVYAGIGCHGRLRWQQVALSITSSIPSSEVTSLPLLPCALVHLLEL